MEAEQREAWRLAIAEANDSLFGSKVALDNLVIDARKAGVGWLTIAEGIGITRQAAMERFLRLPEIAQMQEVGRR